MQTTPFRELAPAVVVVVAGLSLGGCEPRSKEPPLKTGPPPPEQTEALRQMNEVGANAYRGHTWGFEWCAAWVLGLRPRFQGHPESLGDHSLAGRRVEVIPYAPGGFGVKAYLPK